MNRRSFLKVAGSTLATLPVLPAVAQLGRTTTMAAGTTARSFTPGRYALELDGKVIGWIDSVEGGDAVGQVVEMRNGATPDTARKHIGAVKYEEITITCGLTVGKEMFDWIATSLAGKVTRKNGSIIAADYNYKAISSLKFFNALITEIGFPALDASSKDVAKMTIKFAPEYTRTAKGGQVQPPPGAGIKQKAWLCSNFKLTIGGLDCTRVNKIDAIVIKQIVQNDMVGITRDPVKVPSHVEIPNLAFTTSVMGDDDLIAWHEDFVINGRSIAANEKNGSLTLMTPDLRDTLLTINFHSLGVFKCTPEKMEAGADTIGRIRAEMYCNQIDILPAPTL